MACSHPDDYLYKPLGLGQMLTRVDLFCRKGYGKHALITKAGDWSLGNDVQTTRMPLAILTKNPVGTLNSKVSFLTASLRSEAIRSDFIHVQFLYQIIKIADK